MHLQVSRTLRHLYDRQACCMSLHCFAMYHIVVVVWKLAVLALHIEIG